MEQNNLEEQVKKKLGSIEIQPSTQAWDRLDAMLTIAEKKKLNQLPFWFSLQNIGIAASVLVMVTLGLFFFNHEKTALIPINEIVVTPKTEKVTIKNELPNVKDNRVVANDSHLKISNQKPPINSQGVSISNQKNNHNALINHEKEIEYLIGESVALKNVPKVFSTEPIIVNPKKQTASKKTTYIDVDALLASAESAPKAHSKSNQIIVDANTLLLYADSEVETTFREKVINGISRNFQEVKSALANRNQE